LRHPPFTPQEHGQWDNSINKDKTNIYYGHEIQ
jgi:hypothetical protein